MNKYKFNSQDHLHLIYKEELQDYTPLTGTTTIIEVLSKPLHWWASGMAVAKLGWLNPKKATEEERIKSATDCLDIIKGLDSKSYLELLDSAYKAHSDLKNQKAEEGTELHEELEAYIKWHISFNSGKELDDVQPKSWSLKTIEFAKWVDKNVKRFIASEVNVYDQELFVGGIVDCIAELQDGKVAIIDFKSSKEAYFSQFIQCALYDLQLKNGYYDQEGKQLSPSIAISSYVVCPFGSKELAPTIINNTNFLRESAKSCVQLYRSIDSYNKITSN
jgi:hypothetical protein